MRHVHYVFVMPIAVACFVGTAVLVGASPSDADEVIPIAYNRFCTDTVVSGDTVPGLDTGYGEVWKDVRVRNLNPSTQTYDVSDGTASIHISDFDGTSFDWESNLPLDGVFVNAGSSTDGSTAHRFYRYAPERTSGSGLTSSDGVTPIDHISFCYDLGGAGYGGPAETHDVAFNRYCTDTVVNGRTVPGLDDEYGDGGRWVDLRIRDLDGGQPEYSVGDGTVNVTVTGFDGTSFDWVSTAPLVGVFVNAGAAPDTSHRFYLYDPPISSDSGLTAADGLTAIDHISFCYSAGDPGPSSTTTAPTGSTTAPSTSTTTVAATSSSTVASSTTTATVAGASGSTTTSGSVPLDGTDPDGGAFVAGEGATLPFTGADPGLLVILGSTLLAGGAAARNALRSGRRSRR